MARAMRRRPARGRKPNRRVRRARVAKRGGRKASLAPTNQHATIVESLATANIFSDRPYNATFQLSQFFRASALAKNFRFYRAKKVKWEYMPLYNTFQENIQGSNSVGKPQFYMMMNRDQNNAYTGLTPTQALFSIQCAGADPTPFTKNREIIYRPNWCSPGLTAIKQSVEGVVDVVSLGNKAQYGWLPTPIFDAYFNPDTPSFPVDSIGSNYDITASLNAGVVYNGHYFYIQQSNEPLNKVGTVVVTVEWEFKGGKQLYGSPPTVSAPHEDVSGAEL